MCNYLLSMYKASSHSLLILLRRAELEFVLKRPSDLRRKPNEMFWLLRARFRDVRSYLAADNYQQSYRQRSHCWTARQHSANRRERMRPSFREISIIKSTFLVTLSSIKCLTLFFTFRMSFSFSSCKLFITPSFIRICLQPSETSMLKFQQSSVILLTIFETHS